MKTSKEHEYHGITLRNDGFGWAIQIRLLGSYQVIRSYAESAEEAAYRHDVALSKLDAFIDANARPNFPDTFKDIDTTRGADKRESYQKFWDALHAKFSQLAQESEAAGLDVCQMRNQREERAKESEKRRAQKREAARTVFRLTTLRQDEAIRSMHLDAATSQRLSDLLKTQREVLDAATKTQ